MRRCRDHISRGNNFLLVTSLLTDNGLRTQGRAPALLDNLAQAFLMAPYFVLLEVLFQPFCYIAREKLFT
jgi:uncharacterized membrane protein YGL010W